MLQSSARARRLVTAFVAAIAMLATLSGCAVKHPVADVVNGKVMFQKSCGSCHTLSHANTTGTTGPNLDDAFRQDRIDGVKSTSIEGLVDYWIKYPNSQGVMPSMLLKGQDAQDVAAYIALVAAVPGKDTGALASAGGVTGTSAAAGAGAAIRWRRPRRPAQRVRTSTPGCAPTAPPRSPSRSVGRRCRSAS